MRGLTIAPYMLVAVLMGCDGIGIVLTSGDAIVDHGFEPDVYYDPPYDPPYEPPRDPPPDPHPDPDCTGLTAPFGGVCHIVEQCGCMPGFACDFAVDVATCVVIEDCVAGYGTLPVEAECTFAGECRPGTACLFDSGEPYGRCREWCVDSSDCTIAGRECSVTISFTLPPPCTGTGTVPYNVCSLGCPPSAECDLFASGSDPTGCPYGQTCVRDNPIASGGCDINMCVAEGTGEEGDECSETAGACFRGMGCYGNETEGYHCRLYCDTFHECTTGACAMLGA
ncbi:MAG: hypothetical protein JRG91_18110, partial [Deltaproteobacteria bacterium]|nr:hypothetical protein [Deltaproteobacteria bacterium]